MFGDWHQLWEIASAPDNVPIVGLLFVMPFFLWYALKQAIENDRLIAILESDAQLAKTKYRKTQPYDPKWDREVHTWPYLMRMEFLVAIIITVILMVWSLTLNAPLEEPSNPNVTMNPAKAPWYFLGLQEMLVYFDPWIAGVVMPTLIIVGLMAIPYIDSNPLGNGYYTYKQRRFAIWTFLLGFVGLWEAMIVIGCAFTEGVVWAVLLCSSTTRLCPTGTPEALARGTEAMQHMTAQSSAAATPNVPRRAPGDFRAA